MLRPPESGDRRESDPGERGKRAFGDRARKPLVVVFVLVGVGDREALDGTVEAVPDTPANAAVFGRHPGTRGDAAFPQLQAVYLAECGTHASTCRAARLGHRRQPIGIW